MQITLRIRIAKDTATPGIKINLPVFQYSQEFLVHITPYGDESEHSCS